MEFEFDLNKPIEALTNVPAEYQGLYTQTDAGYVVADQYKPIAKNINGLSSNLKDARGSLKTANGEAAERRVALAGFNALFDGIEGVEDKTPEALRSHLEDLAKKAVKGGKAGEAAAAELEAAKQAITSSFQSKLDEANKVNEGLTGEIRSLLIDNRTTSAIAAAEGNPALLSPMIKGECEMRVADTGERVVVILDDKGEPRYNGEGSLLTIEQRVSELKEDPAFQGAFSGQVRGGSETKKSSSFVSTNAGGDPSKKTASQKISSGLAARRKA